MLVKRVDLDLLGGPSFEAYKNFVHKILSVSIRLDKTKRRMSGFWKYSFSFLDEKDFRDQLELILKREFTVAVIGNRRDTLKNKIRSLLLTIGRDSTLIR